MIHIMYNYPMTNTCNTYHTLLIWTLSIPFLIGLYANEGGNVGSLDFLLHIVCKIMNRCYIIERLWQERFQKQTHSEWVCKHIFVVTVEEIRVWVKPTSTFRVYLVFTKQRNQYSPFFLAGWYKVQQQCQFTSQSFLEND